jgi:outer membrane protein assembly factor BamE
VPPVFSRRLAACALAALALSSCQTVDKYMPQWRSFGVYKLDINQGNYLTQDMVDKLKVGMTTAQVQSTLGTPLLADPFHADRWDYIYRYTRQDKVIERREFRVYFVDSKLARWEGDEAPQSAMELNRIAAERSIGKMPSADDKNIFQRFLDIFKREPK